MRREDYIQRLIAQFVQALLHIAGLVKAKQYQEALAAIDQTCLRLLGIRLDAVSTLSESALFARLTFDEPAPVGRDKCLVLAALLDEARTIYAAQGRPDESYACLLQALHLMLEVALRGDGAPLPDYAPRVEDLVAALSGYALPARTNATLFHYYEQVGAYARAEDMLFAVLAAEPGNRDVVESGIAFYERLRRRSDAALRAGDLPRDEVETGLAELRAYSP